MSYIFVNITNTTICCINGEGGIRTHAPLRTNGFQDRLVMTTSIPLPSAPPGARTPHTLIKSQVLYQMS